MLIQFLTIVETIFNKLERGLFVYLEIMMGQLLDKMTSIDGDEYTYSDAEVCQILGCCRETLWHARKNDLPPRARKIKGRWHYHEKDIIVLALALDKDEILEFESISRSTLGRHRKKGKIESLRVGSSPVYKAPVDLLKLSCFAYIKTRSWENMEDWSKKKGLTEWAQLASHQANEWALYYKLIDIWTDRKANDAPVKFSEIMNAMKSSAEFNYLLWQVWHVLYDRHDLYDWHDLYDRINRRDWLDVLDRINRRDWLDEHDWLALIGGLDRQAQLIAEHFPQLAKILLLEKQCWACLLDILCLEH